MYILPNNGLLSHGYSIISDGTNIYISNQDGTNTIIRSNIKNPSLKLFWSDPNAPQMNGVSNETSPRGMTFLLGYLACCQKSLNRIVFFKIDTNTPDIIMDIKDYSSQFGEPLDLLYVKIYGKDTLFVSTKGEFIVKFDVSVKNDTLQFTLNSTLSISILLV